MYLVFFIDNGLTIGGGHYAQFKFAEHLALRGHKVVVFAHQRNSFFDDLASTPHLSIHLMWQLRQKFKGSTHINGALESLYNHAVIEPFIKKEHGKIDFLIGHLRASAIKAVRFGKKYDIKTANFIFENPAWMARVLGSEFTRQYKGRFKRSWIKARAAYELSNVLIPNSKTTGKECKEWVHAPIADPVFPGLDVPAYLDFEKRYQIVYVGRLHRYKNVDILMRALHRIKKAPKLVLIGRGPEEIKLRSLAKKLQVVCEFKGELTDTEKFVEVAQSQCMVFPTSFEGFGMPPAEALACSIPCICSDIPVLREVYRSYVDYVEVRNVEALRKKIVYLLAHPHYREKMGKKGSVFVRRQYSWKQSAKTIETILRKQ